MREIIQNNQNIKKKPNLDPRLLDYVIKSRGMGINEEDIVRRLLKGGSRQEDIDRALSSTKIKNEFSFLAPISKPDHKEHNELNESRNEKIESRFLKKEKKHKNFFSKKLWIIIGSLILLTGFCFAGYRFFTKDIKKINSEVSCSFEGSSNPDNTGSAVSRIDSTMKLLIKAMAESNYCQVLSLYTEGSRDKYKDLIKTIIGDESKKNKFLIDLNGYRIPAIDENDPSADAKATITSGEGGGITSYYIIFSRTESGEYLIASM
jgi:hypothetical protein